MLSGPGAGIAQLVERLICNQDVAGSNPAAGTIHSCPAKLTRTIPLPDGGIVAPPAYPSIST